MLVPFTRVMTVVMAGVICFGVLLPAAMRHHNAVLGIALAAIFVAYLGVNVLLWQRLKPRA